MAYTLFKIVKLKNESDFAKVFSGKNEGSVNYFKCWDHIKKQKYYYENAHHVRKDGIIAIWLHFEYHYDKNELPVDVKRWETVTEAWVIGHLCRGEEYLLLKKTDKQENLYLYDRVFSLHDPSLDGKLDFSGFHGKADWMVNIQKMYSLHMNSVFGTTAAPEQAKLAFINDGTRNSGVDDKGFPRPLPDENINKYYERVKAYNIDKNNKRNKQVDDTRKLREENEKLRERHRNDVLELKRYEKLESILKAYPDFRTLNAVLSAGERIRTIHQYYKDQDNKETVDYIDTLLKYGQQILDNMNKQEKGASEYR